MLRELDGVASKNRLAWRLKYEFTFNLDIMSDIFALLLRKIVRCMVTMHLCMVKLCRTCTRGFEGGRRVNATDFLTAHFSFSYFFIHLLNKWGVAGTWTVPAQCLPLLIFSILLSFSINRGKGRARRALQQAPWYPHIQRKNTANIKHVVPSHICRQEWTPQSRSRTKIPKPNHLIVCGRIQARMHVADWLFV